ncbi:MAG: hypothetical protein Q9212_002412 [Teloschistes hypoglaucus]
MLRWIKIDSPEAPPLVKGIVNRVILDNGSFNPPHQGHPSTLRYIDDDGVHDLNVIAAIVRPLADDYSSGKGRKAGGSFTFDRETRCMLWKKDLRLPSKRVHSASAIDPDVPRANMQYTLTTMETDDTSGHDTMSEDSDDALDRESSLYSNLLRRFSFMTLEMIRDSKLMRSILR